MKVGIITFHRAKNIGAMLQAYALQKTLNKYYDCVEIIDYRNYDMENNYKIKSFKELKGIKSIIKNILTYKKNINFEKIRNEFISNYYCLSKKIYDCDNIKEANNEYDLFCAGSDQIWNTKLNYNDMTYFLNFVNEDKKMNSYAASFGSNIISDDNMDLIVNELNRFNNISVREDSSKELLKDFLHEKQVNIVLDPTLLLSKKEWIEFANNKFEKPKYKYIFLYLIAPSDELIDFAYKMAKKRKYKIICFHNGYKKYRGMNNLSKMSPLDFINYINNSELVLTSSFHGLCFSVLMGKNFYFSLDKNKNNNNSRLISITKILGLEDRNINSFNESNNSIDYNIVNKVLNKEINKSLDYIKSLKEGVK